MKVQVAFDLSANGVGDYFTLDDTTKGVLDNATYVLGGDVLVDLTDRVRSVQVKRGRNLQLGRFTAGAANVTFDNRDRYLDPLYTSSPYNGSIVPGKQVQIEHLSFPMFTGNVADWNLSYDIGGDSTAEASCTDGLASIANQVVTAGTATAQLTGARIGAYLTDVGWSTTARALSAGQATLGADVIDANTNAITYLTAAVDSDPGALFVGKTGLMTFRDRNDLQSFTSGATFGPSAIPFVGIQVQYGAETLYPTVIVNYWGGTAVAQVTSTDATAASLYGNADLTVDTLLGSNTDASALAGYLLGRYANPVYRVESLTVALHGITTAQVTSVLNLELGDMILLDGWTPNGVGSAISQYLTIEGIEHQADPAAHFVTFTLSQAQASFQLDSAIFGVLDEDRIGF
jgi:hypothetical protein